ncbi:MAG: phosphate-starvation-inducible PsiE family protein [Bacteroidales bacterium]|nr:phosphate-starvation-inducible PsiE family protein [Bacteroidales bacterium]
MLKIIHYLEKFLISSILLVFSIILLLAFIDVSYEIYLDVIAPPLFVVDANNLMELFSLFLIILIGIELLETIKAYLKSSVVHVELVVLVAIIAIARKVIVWDFNKYTYNELIALAVMVIALGITFFLVKKAGTCWKIGTGASDEVKNN